MVGGKHTRTLASSIVLVCLAFAAMAQSSTMSLPDAIKQVRPSVVEILVSDTRRGTGFCISSNGEFATATHVVGTVTVEHGEVVVNYEPNISVRLSDGHTLVVKPVIDPSPEAAFHDITVLKAAERTPHFLRLGTPSTVQDGEDVFLMGFPFDVPAAVTYRGTVSAQFPIPSGILKGLPIQTKTIHVQAPVAKGFSGSPLLRMSDQTVVGVITNKLGGISPQLDQVRQNILSGQKQGSVRMLGVDPNQTALDLINVLDNFLSAGAGWAVSTDYLDHLLPAHVK